MKLSCGVLTLSALVCAANAATYSFTPDDGHENPADVLDLDHGYAYSWGIGFDLAPEETITSASLRFSNIWNWQVEDNILFVQLLNNPGHGIWSYTDADDATANFFGGVGTPLFTWTDPAGGALSDPTFDLVYNFTEADLAILTGYLSDPSVAADFGFGFDPDCHYWNDGVTFTMNVPDGGSTITLAGGAVLAIGFLRRRRLA